MSVHFGGGESREKEMRGKVRDLREQWRSEYQMAKAKDLKIEGLAEPRTGRSLTSLPSAGSGGR